nr:GAF domain-containing protein [Deltaproteobacteria bacterium]
MNGAAITPLEGDLASRLEALEAFARRASVLHQLMADLAQAESVGAVGEAAARHGGGLFGATASLVFLVDPAGRQLELVSFGGVPTGRVEPWRVIPLDTAQPLPEAVRTGMPLWYGTRAEVLAASPQLGAVALDGKGLQGVVALPMRDSRAIIGGIAFSFYEPPDLGGVQRDFYLTVASQCGLAIERARSRAAERNAHEAEARAKELLLTQRERLVLLADATKLLSSELDSRKALGQLAAAVVPALGDWCAIDERAPDGSTRQLALHHDDPAKLAFAARLHAEYPPIPDESRGLGKVLRTGETEWMAEIPSALLLASARDATHEALLRSLDLTSYAVVAIKARGRVLGALTLVTEGSRRMTRDDVDLVEDLAGWAGLALENARLFEAVEGSRAHLHHLLMRLPAAIAILRGPELRYELLNEDGETLIGQSPIGRPMREVFPHLVGTSFFEPFERVYETGEPFVASEVPIGLAAIPGDRYFDVVYQPTRDGAGSIDGLVTFAFEVTTQVLARRRIEALADDLQRAEAVATQHAATQAALNELAHVIAGERDLERMVQSVTDVATTLTGAQFGAFFYNVLDEKGAWYTL